MNVSKYKSKDAWELNVKTKLYMEAMYYVWRIKYRNNKYSRMVVV